MEQRIWHAIRQNYFKLKANITCLEIEIGQIISNILRTKKKINIHEHLGQHSRARYILVQYVIDWINIYIYIYIHVCIWYRFLRIGICIESRNGISNEYWKYCKKYFARNILQNIIAISIVSHISSLECDDDEILVLMIVYITLVLFQFCLKFNWYGSFLNFHFTGEAMRLETNVSDILDDSKILAWWL